MYMVGTLVLLSYALVRRNLNLLWPKSFQVALIASLMFIGGEACWLLALPSAPLANLFVLIMMIPILVILFSYLFLYEKLCLQQGLSIFIAFAGALLMMQERLTALISGQDWLPYLLTFATCILVASRTVYLRACAKAEQPIALIFINVVLGLFICLPISWRFSSSANLSAVLLASSGGFFDMLALVLLVFAVQRAKAPKVQALQYSQMVWAVLAGYLIWKETPTVTTMLGAVLVVGSGVALFATEKRQERMQQEKA